MYDYNITAKRLKILIKRSGKTMYSIAKELRCSTSIIPKHCNGDTKVSLAMLVNYAHLFNVSTDYLLGLTDTDVQNMSGIKVCEHQRKKAAQIPKRCLDDTLAELQAYNEENNTNLSYGEFMSMKSYRKAK